MNGSGSTGTLLILPLLLLLGACDNPVAVEIVEEEPAEVETCEWLIPIGIELVNDYFYALQETDLRTTLGDPERLPTSIVALNARGDELDRRAQELDCDIAELNMAIATATDGLESADPVVNVLLETVRAGVFDAGQSPVGDWVFVEGTVGGDAIELAPDQSITLAIAADGTASGKTGCNDYTILEPARDGEWPVAEFDVTAASCPSEVHLAAQDAYLRGLLSVRTYVIEEEAGLVLQSSAVELRFERIEESD